MTRIVRAAALPTPTETPPADHPAAAPAGCRPSRIASTISGARSSIVACAPVSSIFRHRNARADALKSRGKTFGSPCPGSVAQLRIDYCRDPRRKPLGRYIPNHNSRPVYAAAQEWAKRCLAEDGSVFSDELRLWRPELLDELDQRFVRNLDAGEGNFLEKLREQLSGGSPQCRQLMAELLWLLMLFQSNIGPEKKMENVSEAWSWSGTPLPDDVPMLADAVIGGLGLPERLTTPSAGVSLRF